MNNKLGNSLREFGFETLIEEIDSIRVGLEEKIKILLRKMEDHSISCDHRECIVCNYLKKTNNIY